MTFTDLDLSDLVAKAKTAASKTPAKRLKTQPKLSKGKNESKPVQRFQVKDEDVAIATVKVIRETICDCGAKHQTLANRLMRYQHYDGKIDKQAAPGTPLSCFPKETVFTYLSESVEACDKCTEFK
jgi:hypothetical protein